MIGYTPFLGQVRLVHLGQEELARIPNFRPREEVLRFIEDAERRLQGRPDCDPDGTAMAIIARLKTWAQTAPEGSSHIAAPGTPEYDVMQAVEDCMARLPAPEAPSTPIWVWAIGGLAAAGLIAFAATRE